jgi:hypothetical protein
MLETLRKHDRKEAERILSSLTSELLPNPDVHTRVEMAVDTDIHSRVWNEIRRRVKVDPSDASPASRSKLFEFLFSEMSQRALPKSTLESVKARLSLRGELRSDLYDVRFHRSFGVSEAHGVRRNHVLEAIRNADDVEHLNLLDDEELISFFLRTHNDFPNKDPFVLLVLARRAGGHLEVSDALRAYLSDVDISGAQRPLDVLRLIVERYGFLITIGEITAKLIFDKTVTLDGPLDARTFVRVHALSGASTLGKVVWRKRALHNSYGIAWAFVLDQTKYAADLRKHGVRVDRATYTTPVLGFAEEDSF